MRRAAIFFALGAACAACSPGNDTMTILGTAPERYDGVTVYLVPQPDPDPAQVDSTKIKGGRFMFHALADRVRMCDITLSRRAQARTQRLLIAVEPGRLHVVLDTVSSARGTPLNDQLQQWKQRLERTADRLWQLRAQRGEEPQQILRDSILVAERAMARATYELIRDNLNPMGGYIYAVAGAQLDSLQRARLDSLGIGEWIPASRRPK